MSRDISPSTSWLLVLNQRFIHLFYLDRSDVFSDIVVRNCLSEDMARLLDRALLTS